MRGDPDIADLAKFEISHKSLHGRQKYQRTRGRFGGGAHRAGFCGFKAGLASAAAAAAVALCNTPAREMVYKSFMNEANVIADIRFGLGSMPGQPKERDPRGALAAQLAGPDPGQAAHAFDGLGSGLDGVDAARADAIQRKAILQAGLPLAGNFTSQARALYVADVNAQLAWAASTAMSFRERLVWFWANHFTVSVLQGETAALAGPMIREAIRPHVTGNFTDMVLAVERHPAMLRYLANEGSVGPDSAAGIRQSRGLNENLGRECMELHTVGLAAGYSQADVTSMAKLLTGWSVAPSGAGGDPTGFKYQPTAHEPGPQTLLGRSFDGGQQAGVDALTFLSTYPTTYQMLARKLAIHFVADNPPPAAVAKLARVLADTGGDLSRTCAALVELPEAWVPLSKLKTPFEYVVSAVRAAPVPPGQPPMDWIGTLNQLGQPVWSAPLPNGWPDQAASWDGSDALLTRVNWAFTYAGRFDAGDAGPQPADIAGAALGGLLRPATARAVADAGSRREAVTMLLTAPEFQRR
jgi:uncharacterized protein (DUF1800 family)